MGKRGYGKTENALKRTLRGKDSVKVGRRTVFKANTFTSKKELAVLHFPLSTSS